MEIKEEEANTEEPIGFHQLPSEPPAVGLEQDNAKEVSENTAPDNTLGEDSPYTWVVEAGSYLCPAVPSITEALDMIESVRSGILFISIRQCTGGA